MDDLETLLQQAQRSYQAQRFEGRLSQLVLESESACRHPWFFPRVVMAACLAAVMLALVWSPSMNPSLADRSDQASVPQIEVVQQQTTEPKPFLSKPLRWLLPPQGRGTFACQQDSVVQTLLPTSTTSLPKSLARTVSVSMFDTHSRSESNPVRRFDRKVARLLPNSSSRGLRFPKRDRFPSKRSTHLEQTSGQLCELGSRYSLSPFSRFRSDPR